MKNESTLPLTPCAPAIAARAVLGQCSSVLESLDRSRYTARSCVIAESTIGQHVRHALDHFVAALSAGDGSVIDYDHRDRDTPIERDPAAADALIQSLQSRLESIEEGVLSAPCRVRVMLSAAGEEAELGSTLARELAFATHHAIHHHAMIVAIARELGTSVPSGFGKAPSTLHHEGGVGAEG